MKDPAGSTFDFSELDGFDPANHVHFMALKALWNGLGNTRGAADGSETQIFDGFTLTYRVGETAQRKAYYMLLEWFKKHELFHGDSIHQTDKTYEEAPELLSELAEEVFKFKAEYEE